MLLAKQLVSGGHAATEKAVPAEFLRRSREDAAGLDLPHAPRTALDLPEP